MNNIISAATGILIALMLLFNGYLAEIFGIYTSSVLIHMAGLITVTVAVLAGRHRFDRLRDAKWYLYSAGAIGVITVIFNSISFSGMGVSLTLAVSLRSQSRAAIIIDRFGLLGMKKIKLERQKITGLVLIVSGIIVMSVF